MTGPASTLVLAGLALGVATLPLAAAEKKGGGASMLPGAGSHEPISIDAGKLDYFDKEQKLVYSGSVVVVQGESTLKASQLVIFLAKDAAAPATGEVAAAAGAVPGPAAQGSSVSHMDAIGPVTLISKDQVGTGDKGTYDKADNKVTLTGHVTLSQGANVTKGDKLVYDMTSGQAQVYAGQTSGRVMSVFTPGSGGPALGAPETAKKPKAKPATAAATR